MDRLIEERMKVEQRIDSGLGNRAYVAQGFLGLGVVPLRLEIEIEPLQTVRDGPAEERAIGARGTGERDLSQQLEYARFVGGLDDDQRRSRFENEL